MPLEKRQSTPLLYVTFHEVAAYRASNDVVGALTRSLAIVDLSEYASMQHLQCCQHFLT
jgi:hypothetical protein